MGLALLTAPAPGPGHLRLEPAAPQPLPLTSLLTTSRSASVSANLNPSCGHGHPSSSVRPGLTAAGRRAQARPRGGACSRKVALAAWVQPHTAVHVLTPGSQTVSGLYTCRSPASRSRAGPAGSEKWSSVDPSPAQRVAWGRAGGRSPHGARRRHRHLGVIPGLRTRHTEGAKAKRL